MCGGYVAEASIQINSVKRSIWYVENIDYVFDVLVWDAIITGFRQPLTYQQFPLKF